LSTVYLVRHGQAGTRDAYDSLSDLGRRQARLFGEHFVSQGIQFAFAVAGALTRQRQTAEEVSGAFSRAGLSFPSLSIDPRWNEFDLGQVYSEIAPLLCAEDQQFRLEYERMQEQIRVSDGADAAIHRKWLPCDTKLVSAWISGRYAYSGERWQQFCGRVASCRLDLGNSQQRKNIVVFTSATPIAIWTGMSLDICDDRLMQLAGVLYNASYTVMRLRDGQLRLFTFNAAPHLSGLGLRTHR
jgi:broad specificity phosphatase PhoE